MSVVVVAIAVAVAVVVVAVAVAGGVCHSCLYSFSSVTAVFFFNYKNL